MSMVLTTPNLPFRAASADFENLLKRRVNFLCKSVRDHGCLLVVRGYRLSSGNHYFSERLDRFALSAKP